LNLRLGFVAPNSYMDWVVQMVWKAMIWKIK